MLERIRALFSSKPPASPLVRLRLAVEASDTVSLRELIKSCPHLLNHQDEKGETPLHWAAEKQDLSVVAALVDLGVDTTKKDKLGYTAAYLAQYYGEFRMGCYTEVSKKIVERIKKGVPNTTE